MHFTLLVAITFGAVALTQELAADPGRYGPPLEIVHLYYDQFPTGFAISKTGRMFTTYPGSIYANNTNNYTLGELTGNRTEVPYPNMQINSPPGGRVNHTVTPPSGVNYQDYLIAVQGLVIDASDRLWLLDVGRVLDPVSGTLVPAVYGGPKLVGIDLRNNSIFQTIVFEQTVAYPESFLNDLRIDLRPSITSAGKGVAYITDSSSSGRNGLIAVDLGTGHAWRHLDNTASVRATTGHFQAIWGEPVYSVSGAGPSYGSSGADGLALSPDGETLYWSVTGSRNLYAIATALLRAHGGGSETLAQSGVRFLGEKGVSDGLDSDSRGRVYAGSFETNSIVAWEPGNASVRTVVRDPRIAWTDAIVAGPDKFLYFNENQLWRTPRFFPAGVDRTTRPIPLFRVPLADGAERVALH